MALSANFQSLFKVWFLFLRFHYKRECNHFSRSQELILSIFPTTSLYVQTPTHFMLRPLQYRYRNYSKCHDILEGQTVLIFHDGGTAEDNDATTAPRLYFLHPPFLLHNSLNDLPITRRFRATDPTSSLPTHPQPSVEFWTRKFLFSFSGAVPFHERSHRSIPSQSYLMDNNSRDAYLFVTTFEEPLGQYQQLQLLSRQKHAPIKETHQALELV